MVRDVKGSSTVGRTLIARTKGVINNDENKNGNENENTETSPEITTSHNRSNYYVKKADIDPFPNPALIYLPDKDQNTSVDAAVEDGNAR